MTTTELAAQRAQVRATLAKRYGWPATDITEDMVDAVLNAGAQ